MSPGKAKKSSHYDQKLALHAGQHDQSIIIQMSMLTLNFASHDFQLQAWHRLRPGPWLFGESGSQALHGHGGSKLLRRPGQEEEAQRSASELLKRSGDQLNRITN